MTNPTKPKFPTLTMTPEELAPPKRVIDSRPSLTLPQDEDDGRPRLTERVRRVYGTLPGPLMAGNG